MCIYLLIIAVFETSALGFANCFTWKIHHNFYINILGTWSSNSNGSRMFKHGPNLKNKLRTSEK